MDDKADEVILAQSLSEVERKVLPVISKMSYAEDVAEKTGLQEIEVLRAFQWLQNKDLAKISDSVSELVFLEKNGDEAIKKGLPERIFLDSIVSSPKKVSEMPLDEREINACIGILKKNGFIDIKKEKELVFSLTQKGKDFVGQDFVYESFLKKSVFPVDFSGLSKEEKLFVDDLAKRSILERRIVKEKKAITTAKGSKVLKLLETQKESFAEKLTNKMLKDSSWKEKFFRRYDVHSSVPRIFGGKRHFVNQSIDYARSIWLELGFKEMEGPLLNTSFWNFDSLFTAQDHPVREMQDTFFIKNPEKGTLPDAKLVKLVRESHEKGTSGSTGWQYSWDKDEAVKNVLRTHTTVLSARTLAQLKKDDWPAKYFAVGKCFRNETLDWKHLFEFNQTEGIVVDPNANFRHLLGYLKEFFSKMGYPKARYRPAYFPYTEPSIEIDVFHPARKQWVELGGAGIFRPEVVEPLLGEPVPVLAWGPGFDRIMMEYYKITDMRDIYKNDIKQLREMKMWLK